MQMLYDSVLFPFCSPYCTLSLISLSPPELGEQFLHPHGVVATATTPASSFLLFPPAVVVVLQLLLDRLLSVHSCQGVKATKTIEFTSDKAKQKPLLQTNRSIPSSRTNPSKVVQLSKRPRVYLYEGFLSDEECDHLISLAHGKLDKSMVLDDFKGNSTLSSIRTSSGMFVPRGADDVVKRIEERISAWTFLPVGNGEDMQLLHYGVNESFEPHYDTYYDPQTLTLGGHRIATVLMYLSNVTRGGETIFPMSEMKDSQVKDNTWSPCASTGYAVKPVRGNAVLFFNLYPDATPDDKSSYGGCMVLEGVKWSATKWIHMRSLSLVRDLPASDDGCSDEDDNCPQWAATGECQRNPVYMLGTPDYYGSCRKSCGAC
ncbi:hypothetical protein Taro_046030 [Colocasia esculenta]|uniref:procollagen-proline 4-dioxygenase n=1 Tax=Colocasia esculenta TaxID=4460 RepID=A0A843X524_COLES|nr:hypothetical protein [Colocasia esculenta]